MSDVCVCWHDGSNHGMSGTGDCMDRHCYCPCFRPCLDWPDAEGWWWSEALEAPCELHHTGLWFNGNRFSRETWGYKDRFTKCEPNPFEKEL